MNSDKDAMIAALVKRLGFDMLETRNSDGLDFRDVAVWKLREVLETAFEAGRASATKAAQNAPGRHARSMETNTIRILEGDLERARSNVEHYRKKLAGANDRLARATTARFKRFIQSDITRAHKGLEEFEARVAAYQHAIGAVKAVDIFAAPKDAIVDKRRHRHTWGTIDPAHPWAKDPTAKQCACGTVRKDSEPRAKR